MRSHFSRQQERPVPSGPDQTFISKCSVAEVSNDEVRPALRLLTVVAIGILPAGTNGSQSVSRVAKTPIAESGLALERRTHPGAFFDVVGRRAGVFGYEHRGFEAWIYPLKILEDFRLSFSLEGYPLDVPAEEMLANVRVTPEATIFTYSHAAFTVRQIIFAPLDEPAIVMLLDVSTTLPIRITAAFRPRLRLMWPAGLMTPYVAWDESERVYALTEESRRFAGVIGSPRAATSRSCRTRRSRATCRFVS